MRTTSIRNPGRRKWLILRGTGPGVAAGLLVLASVACESSSPPDAEPSDDNSVTADKSESGHSSETPLFVDATAESGIDFVHEPGATGKFYFPEIMGSGGAWIDIDNDGDLDAYLIQSGGIDTPESQRPPNRLYRNDDGAFTDITDGSGLDDRGYGMGCCVGDVDNDGDNDLYVTNVGENRLYLNDGTGRFENATSQAGVGDAGWGTSCAFLDFDRDGRLDLYVTNYIRWSPGREKDCRDISGKRDYCSPLAYDAPARDVLYHNLGTGAFEDVTVKAGLDKAFGNGLGVVCGDFNQDGWTDIYVANDKNPNNLWINQRNGTFKDEGLISGSAMNAVGQSEASMGVDTADVDFDDDLDLFMTHLANETHTFYRATGPARFQDQTTRLQMNAWSLAATGFGTLMFDVDHDGLLDIFVANGRVTLPRGLTPKDRNPYAERNTLVRQTVPGTFVEVTDDAGPALQKVAISRAALFGDYDNDGDLDILVTQSDGPVQLLRNVATRRGRSAMMRVTTGKPPRDAVGAVIRARRDDGVILRREVRPAGGYCGSNDPRVHLTWPSDHEIISLEITWPDGAVESFEVPSSDGQGQWHQGSGNPAQTEESS